MVDVVSPTIVRTLEEVKDVQAAVSSVVVGLISTAFKAARIIGGDTGMAISKAVTGTISGVKVIVKESFKEEKGL
jgi:hypothetical protein